MKSNTRIHVIMVLCLLFLFIAYGAIMYGILVVLDEPVDKLIKTPVLIKGK